MIYVDSKCSAAFNSIVLDVQQLVLQVGLVALSPDSVALLDDRSFAPPSTDRVTIDQ